MITFNNKFILLKFMRGTEHSLWYTLLQIILVPLLLMVCFGLLIPITKGNITEEITGEKNVELPINLGDKQTPFDLNWVEHVIGSGTQYQLSEVACEIAGKTIVDFMVNTYDKSRQNSQGSNCERDWCLIGVGKFITSPTSNVNQPTDTLLGIVARGAFTGKKCAICEEPPTGGNLIPELDEVCINYNLWSKNNDLCSSSVIIGGKTIQFGNSVCTSKYNSDPWKLHCNNNNGHPLGTFCDNTCNNNACDKVFWAADRTKYSQNSVYNPYMTVEDTGNIIDDGQFVRNWKSNDIRLDTNFIDPPEYMYGILWKGGDDKRYEILFEQIPLTFNTNDKNDLDNIQKNMTDNSNFRVNRLGTWYTEAREIEHFYFTPTAEINSQQFYTSLSQDNQKVSFELCNNRNDCINTQPPKRGTTACRDWLMESFLFPSIKDNQITIRSNMAPNENFAAGKTYEISVKNWAGYYFAKPGWSLANTACYDYFDRTISIYKSGAGCTCSDGTACGECSNANRGSWCDNSHNLIPSQCGPHFNNCDCPLGQNCVIATGNCETPPPNPANCGEALGYCETTFICEHSYKYCNTNKFECAECCCMSAGR